MQKTITPASKKFMFDYLNAISPTSREWDGQKVWLEYIKGYISEYEVDNYGTAYGIINPGKAFRVVIEAHADEISWFVNYISKEGYIHVIRNGGSDHLIAPGQRVRILGSKGKIPGVFGWPAIHVRGAKSTSQYTPEVDKLFLDVGATSKDEVLEMGIDIGNIAVFRDELEELNNRFLVGRGLDNRMGGFCIAQVARMIHEQRIELPYSLYIVNAVQEEIGLRGAQMIAERIKPNAAIVTDVTHDTSSPLMDAKKQGDIQCGEGPVLTFAPAVHHKLLDIIFEAAKEKEIKIQRAASSRSTGTDTDAFAYSNDGVPSALISLPLKYMHTTVEMAHMDDIEAVSLLILESLRKIPAGQDFRYFS